MSEKIITYVSENADPNRKWAAFIDLGHDYLGIRFHGATEQEVIGKASAFWEEKRAEREANIARREEGRRKAAETRARKAQAVSA